MALTPSPDIYAANVVLLLPFDENLTDYSAVPKTVTAAGNAAVSTVQKKYGAKSCNFDGTDDYLSVYLPIAIGTDDYTVEFWFYKDSGTNNGLLQLASSSAFPSSTEPLSIAVYNTNSLTVTINSTQITGQTDVTNNVWHHIAAVRQSGVTNIYYDGVKDTTIGDLTDSQNYTQNYVLLGGYYSTNFLWNGYLDEIRITKGVARYTANFTPPQSFFTVEASFNIVTELPILQDLFAAEFTIMVEIPVIQSTAAFAVPVFCTFIDNVPYATSKVQAFHPYNENSELSHTTLPYAPLIKTERNTRFIGRQL
jgi:hypothetical protein